MMPLRENRDQSARLMAAHLQLHQALVVRLSIQLSTLICTILTDTVCSASASAPKAPTDGSAAAAPARPSRVATFANPLTTTPAPVAASQQDPTTIASRTEANSGVFRPPTRAPTAPATLASASAAAPAIDNSTAPAAQPAAPAPAPAAADNAATATAQPTVAPAAPAPPTRDPAAPASLNGGPGAGTLSMQPDGSIASNHPLMRPPTLLSQDAYRQGPGRASAVRPHARHVRTTSTSTRARPDRTPSAPADRPAHSDPADRPLPGAPQ